ncbi:hypothetical protein E2C01_088131 [Portunus trituberculatus]|uniref:Uncharacterized protein n=1 Tax=Portunus trituberculatus TaxID=210409 RepID=A0A5B7JFV1_PORTR|nr:hypothetical protein [Portunus trituberculatus]
MSRGTVRSAALITPAKATRNIRSPQRSAQSSYPARSNCQGVLNSVGCSWEEEARVINTHLWL